MKIQGGHFLGLGMTFIISFALSTASCSSLRQEHYLVCEEEIVAKVLIEGPDIGTRWRVNPRSGVWEFQGRHISYAPVPGETCEARYRFVNPK